MKKSESLLSQVAYLKLICSYVWLKVILTKYVAVLGGRYIYDNT